MKANLKKRKSDKWGQGHFGAPRGDRKHNGIDYACLEGSEILSPVDGQVTKHGYPYADDLSFRYVQITNGERKHRIFYVDPILPIGRIIKEGDVIGTAQDLEQRYPEITPHIHYEIMIGDKYLDPENQSLEGESYVS